MIKKLLAALFALLAATAFAAVDVNKATASDLETVKGIGPAISGKILDERKKGPFKDWQDLIDRVKGVGEGNAAKFSTEGLTVNGATFKGAAPTAKTEAPKAAAPAAKPTPAAPAPTAAPAPAATKAAATAPAAATTTAAAADAGKAAKPMSADDKKAAAAKEKEDKKAAKAKAAEEKKAEKAAKSDKPAAATAKASEPAKK